MARTTPRPPTERPLSVLVGSARPSIASAALKRALVLPGPGRLMVLHVLPPTGSSRSEALRGLEQVVTRAAPDRQPPVLPLVDQGAAHERLVLHGKVDEVDLIVLDSHLRSSPVRDFFLGTTAERVVRTSSIPVLVVNAPPKAPYERPLIALDLSPASLEALELTLRVAKPTSGMFDVIHAFETPNESLYRGRHMNLPPEDILAYRRDCKRKARAKIEAALSRFERAGLRFRITMRRGDPRAAVLKEAARRGSDLIALGTRGHSNLGRMLLGSVASEVLGTATCDVLVAPGGG